ncbi:hypothetical protein [Streptomyces sp. NPDC002133]|uniref:hypothetical protein n=1 Tax=Streptomyces sp. NPDC002133 TaxID=3154409 RepID=UPI0033285C3D
MDELSDDPCPEACVEVSFGPVRPPDDPDIVMLAEPLRITPADLARLRIEAELAMGEIRAEVMEAEIAWKRALGDWYGQGRAAVELREPDVALLVRVLEGLRKKDLVPV